jgi:uncharacterized membrane protein
MKEIRPQRSVFAAAVFGMLDPAAYGMFVGALIFDALYLSMGTIVWAHAASWLITLGLFMAIIPRVINLVQVWVTSRAWMTRADYINFWLNLFAIGTAIFNALIHSRDAYASMPTGFWLSLITVILLLVSHAFCAVHALRDKELRHE